MADKKSWRDYLDSVQSGESSEDQKTSTWRDVVSKKTGTVDTSTSGWRGQLDHAITNVAGNKITTEVNNWLANHNDYLSDYQKRYEGRKYNYEDAYVSDSADWLTTVSQRKNSLDTEADAVLSYIDQYKDYLDKDWVADIRKTISTARGAQGQILENVTKDNEWWSNFGSEDLVKQYGSAEEAYKYYQRDDGYQKKYAGMTYDDIQQAVTTLNDGEELSWIRNNQGDIVGNTIRGNADFEEYAAKGSTIDYTDFGTETWHKGKSRRQRGYNSIDNYRAASMALYEHNGNEGAFESQPQYNEQIDIYRTMKDEEFENLAYCIAYDKEHGTNLAEQYVDSMEATLKARRGTDIGNAVKDIPVIADLYGVVAGVDQFATGLETIFTDKDYYAPSQYQVASGVVRESMADDGFKLPDWLGGASLRQGIYDLTTTTANMAPSILASAAVGVFNPVAGTIVGNTLMGASAAGNAYQDVINRGYGKNEAKVYAGAIGASEAILGQLMGGISKLGGVGPKLTKALAGIDNGLLRFALQYGGKIGSEALEEGMQEILDPILQNAILRADEDIDWSEVAYSALLGGLSAGALELKGTISQTRVEQKLKKQYGGNTDAIIQEGLESDVKSESHQLAQQYKEKTDGGKTLTGAEIRNLLAANQEQITSKDLKKIKTAAEARLTSLGQTENVAEIAEIATKWATGQEITRAEKKLLTNSQYGSRVANELLPSNIESGNYSTGWAEDIGTKQVNAQAYNKTKIDQVRSIIEQMKSNEDPATYKSLEERVDDEEAFNVSKSGQATIRESGETIDLGKVEVAEFITDKKTGKVTDMVLKVDGKDVKASEIDYADGDQSYLFSAVSKIENMTPGDATVILRDYNPNSGITVGQYLNGIDEAYTYGYYGYSEADMQAGNFAIDLTKEQAKSAYMLGQNAKKNSVESDETTKKRMRTAAEGTVSPKEAVEKQKARIKSNDVEVYFQDGKSVVKFDEHTGKYDNKRKAAVNTAKFLSKLGIGGKYYFFESYVNASGDRVYKDNNGNEVEAPNGMYKDADGSIHIDLNAGDSGQGAALFTMGHELGHFVKAQSEKQFKTLSDLVTEAFDKTDMTMHERVLAKQKFLSDKRGEAVSYAEAHEEVVADALSTMLTDGSFYEKIMEIKVKDKGLFNTIKRFFDKMIAKFKKVYEELTPDQKDAQDIRAMKDMFDKIQNAFAEALVEASDNFQAAMESVVDTHAEPVEATEIITDGAVVTNGDGERYSIRSMKHDIADGKMFEDLKNVCGWTQTQVNTLKTQLKDLVEYMIPYRMILDMNETYGMEGRRFSPYKPNSDPLYKISMDFSTLCSKRLLTQYVIENLQLRENRPMSAEEQMAIRDMLNEYRKVEKGLQVACAMCYVEAARLKSPKQIQRWLDDPTPHLINYFALKNTEFNASVKKAQADFKESRGYDRNAPKKDMKQADVTALNKIGPRLRSQYQLSAEEQAIVDKAKTLPNSTYLTAGNLAALSETDPVIYAAYTSFVRTATRSKSLETDEPYYYGDSTRDNGNGIIVSDSFIEAVNKENGMRFSSWSDWRIQHLLDYITAVIDNSVRGAAMHGYTKFGDEVRVLGKTGMMFNMSGVTGTQTGLNPDGSLNFSDTESIDVNEAIQLREEFPEHAGLQCIGVSNDHIIALLRSDIIDYVIPYHVSGLNAALRRMADIHGWKDYTGTQHATIDKSIKLENAVDKEHWHEEPVFSEFFVGYDTGMSGTDAMRASAEKYKKLCNDRGLKPKFEQFANEDNYWKLLIDRKMINQQTGNLIQQKAVTPTFDFNTIKGVVDKFVDNYDAGLEARALNHIVENWDSIPRRIKDLKKGSKTKKSVDTLANETVAAQPTKNSDRKWKPNLDSTEWGIVNYIIDHNKGTAITSTCNMFFEKSKGRTLFGIYSTYDSTLLYASRGNTAEKEHIFVELFREEYKNGNVANTSAEGLRAWAKTVRMQRATNDDYGTGNVAPGRFAGNADLHGRPFGLYSGAALRNVLEDIFEKETAGRTGDGSVKKSERSAKIAGDFADHMHNIVQTKRGWYAKDVFKYVEEHPELGFIELIYAKDKDVKKLLEKFLGGIDDVKVLDQLSWFMGEAYGAKDRTWNPYDGATYPYRGAVRTFRNAIKKRINAIMTEQVGGTNLGIKNGETTLVEVKELYSKLNSNEEMKQFAEKVFATAEKLGVNIRFVNQTLSKQPVAGDNLGDMVEYKTSYFNDTTVTDQRKANTILHELIHACTVYVLDANKTMGDVSWNKSENYNRISNAATRLNRIYFEIQYDSDFQGKYGIKNVKEMVAELANEEFVGLMKKKNLWNHIVDFICELFGIDRGTSAYENARLCVDYILDNPEVSEYKAYANETRRNARYNGYDVFGQTRFSERASNKELAEMDDTALYIKNTDMANYIGMIFSGAKTEETRSQRTLDEFIGKDFYVTDGKYVYGSIVLGEPHKYAEEEFHKKKNQLKHRVPVGDEYDIKPGGIKWAYPIESYKKFDKPKKLSDSKEYKNSFQARQVMYSERGEGTSNRHLLANAFEGITQNSIEYGMIQEYKGRIKLLNEYEEKLSKLNAEIRKLTFGTEGERDSKMLKQLQDEAKKVAENINRNDKKLLSLEASEPLRKVIERERKKESQKTKEHIQQIVQNKKDRADQTEMRHKIRRVIRDLDKVLNRGNKKLNVKEDLQPVVTKALKAADILFTDNYGTYDMLRNGIGADLSDAEEELVNTCTRMLKDLDKMPTDGYDNWQARQEAENRLKAKMSKLNDVFARERKRLNSTTVSSILGELADAYKSLEESEQSYVKGAYMEPVYEFLKNLQSEVGGAIVQDITKAQLESVYAAYKMVLTTVRKANELFNKDIKMSREQLGNAVIKEVMAAGGTHGLWTKGEIARSRASWNNMKPIWVANRIGSESFGKLMQGLFEGQYNFAVDIDEAKRFKLDMDKKYKPRSWDKDKLYEFESSTGKEFSLNLQQIMSLYAFSKREQAYSHLLSGGFVYEANSTVVVDKNGIKRTYLHDGATSYKINEATLNEIIGTLTAEQKAYVDEMQAYLSDVMGAKGNEVSMKLYGIQLFKEKFYFPLRSSGAYMERAKEAEMKKQQGQINLVNSGFTHAVKPQAKNPIILSGFMDVWAEHCNEMSMYHSMVLPMEDFRKVYNYSTVHDESYDSASVYQSIQDAYGKAATDYIDQLYRELNAGATVDPRETPFKAFISKFKKASVMMSASVVVQQFSSVGRAYALIDPKYFIGAKVDSETKLSAADEMKKYAPVAIIKEMGGFDTGTKGSAKNYILAEVYGKGERLKGLKTDEQYRSDLMGFMPAKADEKTWCAIWEAVKRETKAKHPNMDVKSEEFLKLAGERFSEVIEKTQVYDSVLARSANMRSKSAFMNMATAFMAEPTTTINLLEDALRGRSTKKIARVFGAVAVSIVLNNALASVVYAMRDDDEDETFIEKYFQSFTSGMIDDINPMSYYPFLKDVYSLFQGYDVERADMSVIADLRDALKKAVSVVGKDTDSMNDEQLAEHYKSVNEILLNLLDAGCSAFGVPMKNVRRDVNGMINAFTTISKDVTERDNSWLSFWDKVGSAAKDTIPVLAWTKDTAKADKLYDAIISGDKEYLARMKSGYKDESAYHSAVRKALRENDPRIHEAAQARYDGNAEEYKRIFREIKNEGKFTFDEIMGAINSEENAIRNKLEPDKATSNYSTSDFVEAVRMGDTETASVAMSDIISTYVANGKTQEEAENAFASAVSTSAHEAYFSGLLDDAGAKNMLMEYADMDEDEASSKVNYWAFMEGHPGYELSESNVNDYTEFAEPAGINLDIFTQYVEGTKGLVTIYDDWGDEVKSKREQVLDVIDSLPLTWQQKDALYLAAGYSESKIWDVPW